MRRERPKSLCAGLSVAGPPQGQGAADVGVISHQAARTAACGVLGPDKEERRPVAGASLLFPARCGAVVAVVALQVDCGGSPQRTAFPAGSSRKCRAAP
jgi:hypothetical protein